MPSWLLWLSPVPLATLAAIGWTVWAGRPRGPGRASASVAEHQRFRAALGADPGAAPPEPPPSGARVVE